MRDMTPYSGNTMNGNSTCTMPICTPSMLWIICIGVSITPRPFKVWLTTPLRPKMTIQAKVRTRMLVQNGISTKVINSARTRGDSVTIR